MTIDYLSQRQYGGGELLELSILDDFTDFTRYLVSYPSDGLNLYGFVNVPAGEGPFPVILLLHGFVEPSTYNVKTYTTRYADALTRAGYLVIHPNYRNHIPSDEGPNLFRTGYAIDVLNLVAIVEEQGGQPGILEKANPDAIGLWGHSMGGGITLRVITVGGGFDAALIYGSMNSDERLNMDRIINVFSDGGEECSRSWMCRWSSGRKSLHLPIWSASVCRSASIMATTTVRCQCPGQKTCVSVCRPWA